MWGSYSRGDAQRISGKSRQTPHSSGYEENRKGSTLQDSITQDRKKKL